MSVIVCGTHLVAFHVSKLALNHVRGKTMFIQNCATVNAGTRSAPAFHTLKPCRCRRFSNRTGAPIAFLTPPPLPSLRCLSGFFCRTVLVSGCCSPLFSSTFTNRIYTRNSLTTTSTRLTACLPPKCRPKSSNILRAAHRNNSSRRLRKRRASRPALLPTSTNRLNCAVPSSADPRRTISRRRRRKAACS